MHFSANILHCRKRDKGEGQDVLHIHVFDAAAHIQENRLERVADIVVEFRVVRVVRFRERVPFILAVIDYERDHGYVFFAFQEKMVVVFRDLLHHVLVLVGLVFDDDAHVESRGAALLDVRLEDEVRGTGVLVAGEVLLRAAKRLEVDCIEERLESRVSTGKKASGVPPCVPARRRQNGGNGRA